jgi:kumamolisin
MSKKNKIPWEDRIPLEGSEVPNISKYDLEPEDDRWKQDEKIKACVCLRIREDSPGLPSFEEITNTPLSQRKRISQKEFGERYGAAPKDVWEVEEFAWNYGLDVGPINLNHRCVWLTGTVSRMEKAFGVELNKYKYIIEFRGYEGKLSIPKKLDKIVIGVFGLSNSPTTACYIRRGPILHEGWLTNLNKDLNFNLAPIFTPSQVAQAYNFPTDVKGKNQTIGIIELGGGYTDKCLKDYFGMLNMIQNSNLEVPHITDVNCGADNNPGEDPISDIEVCGNIEGVGACANAADLVVYFGDLTEYGFLNALWTAITDFYNYPSIISISYGSKEENFNQMFRQCMNLWLHTAAAINITVSVATGDTGSSDCSNPLVGPDDNEPHVDFPASSPWVLACGGTWLQAQNDAITGEEVWNDGKILGATGGGVSDYFPLPPYQEGCNVQRLPPKPHGNCSPEPLENRGIPDVAGNSSQQSGYLLMSTNTPPMFCGGTSGVSPLWAALIALLNEKLNKNLEIKQKEEQIRLGFINPLLYQIKESNAEGAFKDITEGNNQNFPSVPGYSATPKWDACTGLGTPNGTNLYKALNKILQKEKS